MVRRLPVHSFRLALVALVAGAVAARAQTAPHATVRVTAKDSSGTPITGAELTITRGLKDVVARGTTDSAGMATLMVQTKDSSDFQVTIRKIGFLRRDRFFEVGPFDTARVALILPRPQANTLGAVKVTAKRDDKYESYDLYADEIEATDAPMDNAWDMIKELRPVMLTSRGCKTGVQNVWVNGKRIRLPLPPFGMVAARERINLPIRARFSYVAVSVLSEIAPEHIQEIHYHDCFDTSLAAVGADDAMFVTLKPGVTYVQDVGSFVLDEPSTKPANGKNGKK
jgi:hypothetical protein